MDSWEKIEQEIDNIALHGDPGGGPGCSLDFLRQWAERLRALRERDEKRWARVDACIEYAESAAAMFKSWEQSRREYEASDNMRYLADRLREAREGA